MIEKALQFLSSEVNAFLSLKTGQNNKLTLTNLVDEGGKLTIADGLALTLVNIEEEKIFKSQIPETAYINGNIAYSNPEQKLNLYVLFASYHNNNNNYQESLKLISHVISFFQARNVFNNEKYPQLGKEIEKLIVELCTLGFEQLNQLWTYVGGKYVPSVVYKIRMLVINEALLSDMAPAVKTIKTTSVPRE